MDLKKLKLAIGKKVFVVCLNYGVQRMSEYGKLEEVNEPNNIILAKAPFGDSIIPLDNGRDKILKVYDEQGFVVYDAEKKKKS